MNTTYKIAKKIHEISNNVMKKTFLLPRGGCNSCCPKCKKWEHQGNIIKTTYFNDDIEKRNCGNCGHEWLAIFTPAGFVEVEK